MRKSFIAGISAALCLGAGAAAIAPAALGASADRTVLAGTAAPAVAQSHALGAVDSSTQINFELVLKLRDQAGAQALLQAISTPGSASYRHYVTAAQWEAQFSPTLADVVAARQWLQSAGFTVGAVSKDRITISASGTVAQVESAFSTSLQNYQVAGHTVRLAANNLSVPASIGGIVDGAIGISQNIATPNVTNGASTSSTAASSSSTTAAGTFPPAPGAFVTHPPCGSSYGAATTTVHPSIGNGLPNTVPDQVCGYVPGQLRSAYGLTSANTGAGTTVAVIDAYDSATIGSDATKYFATQAPTEPFSSANFTQVDATPFDQQALCAASGWLDEQAIDVEAVHAMAPDAHILYVGAQDCINGLFNAEQYVIDGGYANVITNSWGDLGGDLLDTSSDRAAWDSLFMLAGSTGIGVQFSSGDSGDDFTILGVSTADYPASSPFITAVGGTSLMIGADGTRTGEVGWQTGHAYLCSFNVINALPGCTAKTLNTWLPFTYDGGSGGFTSYQYLQPWYQAGVVPPALSERNGNIFGPVPLRVEPDISAIADPSTGFLIGLHQTFPSGLSLYSTTRYGGTSLASPVLAGIVADADQAAGQPLGFINPALYRMDLQQPSSINDILPEQNLGVYREDYAGKYGFGLTYGNGMSALGAIAQYRELAFPGPEVYCDVTGNCASRPQTLTAAPGFDSMTGLGSPGTNFISTLAAF